jgi:hypothetical protein
LALEITRSGYTLKMSSGYHHVWMHLDNVHKMDFHIHKGMFEFLVLSFGLTNTSATFQALMNMML